MPASFPAAAMVHLPMPRPEQAPYSASSAKRPQRFQDASRRLATEGSGSSRAGGLGQMTGHRMRSDLGQRRLLDMAAVDRKRTSGVEAAARWRTYPAGDVPLTPHRPAPQR